MKPTAEATDFPFDDLDQLITEEQELPDIPDFPSIWTTDKMKEALTSTNNGQG
jgi:hypothetical protein